MGKLTIGYFADGPWSHLALEKLVLDPTLCIAFICARHDQTDLMLKQLAEKYGINFITHKNINSEDFLNRIRKHRCDLFVSMSFNQIFRKRLIQHPKLQTINCHAGKLPFYRGRNILNWALINDEKEFGVTVHYVDDGIDTGDILEQHVFPISDEDDYATLLERAYPACANLLYETIKKLQAGNACRTAQIKKAPLGFYCTARIEGDERLNWNQSSRDVFNFVRAICRPGPEARTLLGSNEIKINRVRLLPEAPVFKGITGAVINVSREDFLVKTADSYVRVVEWSGADKIRVGDRFK
jgi:methionyl-tRNA formyltransferase